MMDWDKVILNQINISLIYGILQCFITSERFQNYTLSFQEDAFSNLPIFDTFQYKLFMIINLLKGVYNFTKLVKVPTHPTSQQIEPSQFHRLSLKDFAITIKSANLNKNNDPLYWHQAGEEFLERLEPTTNPKKIRSYSVILYHLSKIKTDLSISNIEVPFSVMLPFSSPQSFTSIVSSLSRLGCFNNQFSMIVRKNYQNKKQELGIRQKVTTNYSMVKNGDSMDLQLLESFQKMNMKELITTFRMADNCKVINDKVMKSVCKNFVSRKKQISVLDLSYALQLFGKYKYLPKEVEQCMSSSYNFIKKNMDSGAIQRIWRYFPDLVNNNLITIEFTQQLILTLKMLYKKKELSEQFIRQVRRSLNKIQNLQVRIRCQIH